MKRLQLKQGDVLIPLVKGIMCLLLSSWLVPANAQLSGDRNEMESYNRIFSILNGRTGPIGHTEITYYTGDFYPELKGKVKSVNGSFPESILFLFPELGITN